MKKATSIILVIFSAILLSGCQPKVYVVNESAIKADDTSSRSGKF